MIKAFLDTNVLFSALIFDGAPRDLLRHAAAGSFLPCVSEGVLSELEEVVARPRARKLLSNAYTGQELLQILHDLTEGTLVHFGEVEETEIVPGDPKDNHVLSAAVQMHVDYLVSGDKKHILPLQGEPRLVEAGLQIVSPRTLIEILEQGK